MACWPPMSSRSRRIVRLQLPRRIRSVWEAVTLSVIKTFGKRYSEKGSVLAIININCTKKGPYLNLACLSIQTASGTA